MTAGLTGWLSQPPVRRAAAALRNDLPVTVLLLAEREDIAVGRAAALVASAGSRGAVFEVPRGGSRPGESRGAALAGVSAACAARGVVPVLSVPDPAVPAVDGPGPIDGRSGAAIALADLPELAGHPGTLLVAAARGSVRVPGNRPLLAVPVERLSNAERSRAWATLLPEFAGVAAELAARHDLEPSAIPALAADLRSAADADADARDERTDGTDAVGDAIRARALVRLPDGARLRRPRVGWSDLVLPEDRSAQLREAVDRLRTQATVLDEWGYLGQRPGAQGLRLLFAGPPGTGKTLAAEAMAAEVGADLLDVDLSLVVSKWLGETEKNLAAVFEAAESAPVVLFFDEADALFGARTAVEDAHDRYANLQTAYLLSRLERYAGLAVLATNLRDNIDPAFVRRLDVVVDFQEPDADERLALWRVHHPAGAPLAPEVDLADIARRYPVVGGVIRNASVAAAHLAAADGGTVRQAHLVHALRREYAKAGRPFPGPTPVRTRAEEAVG